MSREDENRREKDRFTANTDDWALGLVLLVAGVAVLTGLLKAFGWV